LRLFHNFNDMNRVSFSPEPTPAGSGSGLPVLTHDVSPWLMNPAATLNIAPPPMPCSSLSFSLSSEARVTLWEDRLVQLEKALLVSYRRIEELEKKVFDVSNAADDRVALLERRLSADEKCIAQLRGSLNAFIANVREGR
jgi:hypothetical protein